jgi:tRNA (mo5U34)-methyltransferase
MTFSSNVARSFPVDNDDPRLQNWYHTIELGNGLVSKATYDHRSIVDLYGLPKTLVGKTALDVGTFDGFWAFELERRGAAYVVGIDIPRIGDFDWLPRMRARLGAEANRESHFDLARAMRGSRVERKLYSVYQLSPETVGTFDVVFCGDVLLHLFNPLQALLNIRSVTKELAVIQTTVEDSIDALHPDQPWLRFGLRHLEQMPGEYCTYWIFSTKALREMMEYAGFRTTEAQPRFRIPNGPLCTSVVGRV